MSNYRAKKKRKARARRVKKLKNGKPILKNRIFWDAVLGVVFVLSLSYLLFSSRAFEIRQVGIVTSGDLSHLVRNVKSAAKQELDRPFFKVFNRKSFFSASLRAIKQRVLEDCPEIETMSIKRVFPHGLYLELFGRSEAAAWCYNEARCFFIDKKGVIFKNAPATSTNGLVLILNQEESLNPAGPTAPALLTTVISEEKMTQILAITKAFEKDLPIELSHFITDSEEMLHAVTKQGWKIFFVLGGDIELSLTKLKLLFEKELTQPKTKNLQYIDLRFSKVYYK